MIQLITYYGVLFTQKGFKHPAVCIKSSRVQNCIFCTEKICDRLFELRDRSVELGDPVRDREQGRAPLLIADAYGLWTDAGLASVTQVEAPDPLEAILDGQRTANLSTATLLGAELPLAWDQQASVLNISRDAVLAN